MRLVEVYPRTLLSAQQKEVVYNTGNLGFYQGFFGVYSAESVTATHSQNRCLNPLESDTFGMAKFP